MGAAASITDFDEFKAYPEIQELTDEEVEQIYVHLKREYENKLREIKVRRLEGVLVRRITTIDAKVKSESDLTKLESSEKKEEETEEVEEKANVPQRLLSRLLDEQQIHAASKGKRPKEQIKSKALNILGDAELDAISRELLPVNAKVNKKALQKLGEEKILPERLQKRLGGPMTADQLKAQKNESMKQEVEAQKLQQKREIIENTKEQADNILGVG